MGCDLNSCGAVPWYRRTAISFTATLLSIQFKYRLCMYIPIHDIVTNSQAPLLSCVALCKRNGFGDSLLYVGAVSIYRAVFRCSLPLAVPPLVLLCCVKSQSRNSRYLLGSYGHEFGCILRYLAGSGVSSIVSKKNHDFFFFFVYQQLDLNVTLR